VIYDDEMNANITRDEALKLLNVAGCSYDLLNTAQNFLVWI